MVGKIGGNDYNFALYKAKNLLIDMVSQVVQSIKDAVEVHHSFMRQLVLFSFLVT